MAAGLPSPERAVGVSAFAATNSFSLITMLLTPFRSRITVTFSTPADDYNKLGNGQTAVSWRLPANPMQNLNSRRMVSALLR
jgi:hypothetical protein